MQEQMHRMEAALARVETMLLTMQKENSEKKQASAARRLQYKEAKEMREKGKISLPTFHVLNRRDGRLASKIPELAATAMKFGICDQPAEFLTWIVYQWNSCFYLKKPITYSGGYFRVHTGSIRCNYGAFDLMGLNVKQKINLRNEGHQIDFRDRPWWNWAYKVLFPVYQAMEELPGFGQLPEYFLKGIRLILGGCGELEVYTDLHWDQNETRYNINRMLKRVGIDLHRMWSACCKGLRLKSPPQIPSPHTAEAAVSQDQEPEPAENL